MPATARTMTPVPASRPRERTRRAGRTRLRRTMARFTGRSHRAAECSERAKGRHRPRSTSAADVRSATFDDDTPPWYLCRADSSRHQRARRRRQHWENLRHRAAALCSPRLLRRTPPIDGCPDGIGTTSGQRTRRAPLVDVGTPCVDRETRDGGRMLSDVPAVTRGAPQRTGSPSGDDADDDGQQDGDDRPRDPLGKPWGSPLAIGHSTL